LERFLEDGAKDRPRDRANNGEEGGGASAKRKRRKGSANWLKLPINGNPEIIPR